MGRAGDGAWERALPGWYGHARPQAGRSKVDAVRRVLSGAGPVYWGTWSRVTGKGSAHGRTAGTDDHFAAWAGAAGGAGGPGHRFFRHFRQACGRLAGDGRIFPLYLRRTGALWAR